MKRPIQLPGQRDWAGDDLIELNNESLKAIEAVVAPYPMCVLSGCEVIASGAKYNISPGYVVLKGVGHDGRNVNRIVPFAGINNTILPLYLTLSYTTISDVYGDGKSKAISQDYKAMAATVKPGGDHLAITATGTVKLVDALQDGGHRFITDSERTTWNGKETPTGAQAKANTALASAKSYAEAQAAAVDTKLTNHNTDSTRHITADERASWKAKETTTGAQTKADAALASAKKHISTYQMSARNHFIEDNSYWQQGQRDANNGIFVNSANRIMLKKAFNTSSTHISVDRISADYEIYMNFCTIDDIYIDCTRTNGFGGVFIDRYPSVVALPAGTGLVYVVMRKTDNSNITPTTTIGKRFMVTTSGNVVGWTHSPEDVDIMAKLNDLAIHSNDVVRHITDAERTSWNAKETPSGAAVKDALILASAKSYAESQAAAVDGKLTVHVADTTKHITATERANWNAKETPSGSASKDAATLASAKSYADATAKKACKDIQVGGVNYLLNSDFSIKDTATYRVSGPDDIYANIYSLDWVDGMLVINGSADADGGQNKRVLLFTQGILPAGDYVLSMDISSSVNANIYARFFWGNMQVLPDGSCSIGTSTKRVSLLLINEVSTVPSTYNSSVATIWFDQIGTFTIDNIKLEKGNKATDWSLSPEEMKNKFAAHDSDKTRHITDAERSKWSKSIQFAMGNIYDHELLLRDEFWTRLTGSGSSNLQVYTRSYKGYLGGINVGVALTNVAREFTIERAWALSKEGYVHCVGDGWVVKRRSDGQLIAMATDSAFVSQAFLITLKYLK